MLVENVIPVATCPVPDATRALSLNTRVPFQMHSVMFSVTGSVDVFNASTEGGNAAETLGILSF